MEAKNNTKQKFVSKMTNDKDINEALRNVLNVMEMHEERECISNTEIFDELLEASSQELNSQKVPIGAAEDYVGFHLGRTYVDNDLKQLLKSFKNNQILDPYYFLKIINDAKEKLNQMANIRECTIDDPLESGCIIIGDLHGNFNDLYHIIKKYGLPGSQYKFIFNGDYVDRGSKQIEVLITLLFSFLIRPNRIFLNRGNHEDLSMNIRSSFDINFLTHCKNYYGKYWLIIFNSTIDLFSYLSFATILKNNITERKYFIVHGGISDSIDLDFIQNQINRRKFKKISKYNVHNEIEAVESKQISDLLWSDPIKVENGHVKPSTALSETGCYFNSSRNLGCLFGYDLTRDFCKRHGFNALIRSHQVKEQGYSEDHENCLTIFSASNYCGGYNYGAIFKVTPNSFKPKPHRYKNKKGDISDEIFLKNQHMIKKFKKLIQLNQNKILPKFEINDESKVGFIRTDKWAQILSDFFKNEITIDQLKCLKNMLCEYDSKKDLINYYSLFPNKTQDSRLEKNYDKNTLYLIKNLFEILDKNNDNMISVSDAKEVLRILNSKSDQNYSIDEDVYKFIEKFDKNKNNKIDLEEFKKTFLEESKLY